MAMWPGGTQLASMAQQIVKIVNWMPIILMCEYLRLSTFIKTKYKGESHCWKSFLYLQNKNSSSLITTIQGKIFCKFWVQIPSSIFPKFVCDTQWQSLSVCLFVHRDTFILRMILLLFSSVFPLLYFNFFLLNSFSFSVFCLLWEPKKQNYKNIK